MNTGNPLRRRPDGTPELRSIDDLLKEASCGEEAANLPGKGRPLDLKSYSATDPQHRIANKLLADNRIVPGPLQERKEAEELEQAARDYLAREERNLAELRQAIYRTASSLVACFPHQQSLGALLALVTGAEPAAVPLPPLPRLLQDAAALRQLVSAYNRRIEVVCCHYLDLLEQANACIDRLNTQVVCSRDLSPRLQLRPLDLEAGAQEIRARCTLLSPLPRDLEERLRDCYRALRPPLWERLLWVVRTWIGR